MSELADREHALASWHLDWGRLLRTARQVAGLSLSELSRATGLSKGYLSKLESGDATAANPSRATLAALARALPSFGPLAHTLEPAAPLSMLAFAQAVPQVPEVAPSPAGAIEENPVALGWRELEVVLALLVLEQAAVPLRLTAVLIARALGRTTADIQPVLERLGAMRVLERRAPSRPGAPPTFQRAADFEARIGVSRVGDALVLAAALLAQTPTLRRGRTPSGGRTDE